MTPETFTLLIAEMGRELSVQTGESWVGLRIPEYHYNVGDLNGPDGLSLRVREEGKQRLEVLAEAWPTDAAGLRLWVRGLAIGVSPEKSPQQLARDMIRRLLPRYRDAYAKQVKEAARLQEVAQTFLQTARRIGGAMQARAFNEPRALSDSRVVFHGGHVDSVTVSMWGSIEIRISTKDVALAEAVIALAWKKG